MKKLEINSKEFKLFTFLTGMSGAGKTSFLTSIPKDKKVLYIACGEFRGHESIRNYMQQANNTKFLVLESFSDLQHLTAEKLKDYDVLFFDSFGGFVDMLIAEQTATSNKDSLSLQSWGIIAKKGEELLKRLSTLQDLDVIVTGLIKRVQDDKQSVFYELAFPTTLKDKSVAYFSQSVMLYANKLILVDQQGNKPVKVRYDGDKPLPTTIDATYTSLKKTLEGDNENVIQKQS